jgi:hypothetical protein
VARNSEPFMRQVFVTGDQDEEILKRQVNWSMVAPVRSSVHLHTKSQWAWRESQVF